MWVARYSDGSELYQYDNDGFEHKFSEIDHAKLDHFIIRSYDKEIKLDLRTGCFMLDSIKKLNFGYLTEKKRLIYFRRNKIILGAAKLDEPKLIEYIGWQATIKGRNVKRIIGLTDTSELLLQCD
jgi:hypothetical protein